MAAQSMKDVMNLHCEQEGVAAEDLELIDFRLKMLAKLDLEVLSKLTKVKRIKLSTNAIEKMIVLPELKCLETLSLGRNNIKKIEGLDNIAGNLKNLWLSYNQISTLNGLENCVHLEQLYLSNNKIASWDEISKLQGNSKLNDLLLVGNPVYNGQEKSAAQMEVIERVPQLEGNVAKLDGVSVAIILSGGDEEA